MTLGNYSRCHRLSPELRALHHKLWDQVTPWELLLTRHAGTSRIHHQRRTNAYRSVISTTQGGREQPPFLLLEQNFKLHVKRQLLLLLEEHSVWHSLVQKLVEKQKQKHIYHCIEQILKSHSLCMSCMLQCKISAFKIRTVHSLRPSTYRKPLPHSAKLCAI